MTLRKATAYSKKKARPFTRKSAKKNKAYIKQVPYSKIVKFNMGDVAGYNAGKHKYEVSLVAENGVQVRDNALEAARMLVHKILEEKAPGQYYIIVKMFPHHFLRENKLAAGAGADRMATGMTQSFGVVVGRGCFTSPGKTILFVSCTDDKAARIARDALATVKSKFACRTRVVFKQVGQ
jgi:large subunit ribosomal protein L10e